MSSVDTGKVLDELGLGLSRLLRYSYGGFLLIVLARVVNPDEIRNILDMPWELTALSALVIGAGIYAVHRSIVIPLHHGLCLILWLKDWKLVNPQHSFPLKHWLGYIWPKNWERVTPDNSYSPTSWLGSIGVPFGRRIAAYTALRRSDFFEERKRQSLNIAHAEHGLVVMTFEGFLLASVYVKFHPDGSHLDSFAAAGLALIFLIASYPGPFVQHHLECLLMRKKASEAGGRHREI
jgi:hypothetical protein